MLYALRTLIHEHSRYLPGVLAVTFSAVLIALQCGLLLGLFTITSMPIDETRADIWVGSQQVQSVDLGRPIPLSHMSRVAEQPGVVRVELYLQAFAEWVKSGPGGGSDLCMVIGSSLEPDAIGANVALTPDLRAALSLPNGVVVDESDLERLHVKGVGDMAQINGKDVTVVGTVTGLKSLAAPWIFCSQTTARNLLRVRVPPDKVTYLLAKCDSPERAKQVAADLEADYGGPAGDMSAFTAQKFSFWSQMHWLTKTKAGIAIGYAALLGLVVGAVVTSQTLYAATTAAAKEFAILLALGIPRWRVAWSVVIQSFLVGIVGTILAYPVVLVIAAGAELAGAKVLMPPWLLGGTAAVTMVMAMLAGLFALRSVRQIEPMNLLR
jgi:putative ABC transport system permease protein